MSGKYELVLNIEKSKVPEVVDSGLAEVGEDIRAWLTVTFSHQVTVEFKSLVFVLLICICI